MKKQTLTIARWIGVLVLYTLLSFLLMEILGRNGVYPTGSDTYYHIYRGDYLYHSILEEGNWYPLINQDWYNGVELLRYWAPLTAYAMAFFQYLAGGDLFLGYLFFCGVVFFFGGISWSFIGQKIHRFWMGTFIGILWFFIPNNLCALFIEGNLARSLSMIFLPVFVMYLYRYLEEKRVTDFMGITISFVLMILCHLGYAGMLALATLLFLGIYCVSMKEYVAGVRAVLAILFGFLLTGVWLLPSLGGGIVSMDASETMKLFFQQLSISLNPFIRLTDNRDTFFYFGLSLFLLAVFGAFLSTKNNRPAFWVAIVLVLLSTKTMYGVVCALPGSGYLWMLRFFSIAICFVLYSFLNWRQLKKRFLVLFCVLIVADCIPSGYLVYGNQSEKQPEERLDELWEYSFLEKAQEMTVQRLALIDESSLGATGAFLTTAWRDGVKSSFGAGWEAAVTSSNISQLNRAVSGGNLTYLFDRCKEMGNDSVVVKLSSLSKHCTVQQLDEEAAASGYELVDANNDYRFYHLEDVTGTFGIITQYHAIGIGTGNHSFALGFPGLEETADPYLDHYSFEELSQYDMIYLAGFAYEDKAVAEDLVTRLSEAGVRIVISADGVPEDRESKAQSFLGVVCNTITFSQGYPLLETIDGELDTDLFPDGHREWETKYVDGLDEIWGRVADESYDIPFFGTVKNDNIIFVGLNLSYYWGLTGDEGVEKLLERAIDMSSRALPERKLVPLTITEDSRGMVIESDYDNVNTTRSFHEIFDTEDSISEKNHMLIVQKGTTTIRYYLRGWEKGAMVSAIALVLWILYLGYLRKRAGFVKKTEEEKQMALQERSVVGEQ